ncbi:probable cytochrome P450 6a14 [Adelges cooleyi]|uniref:probable cytochrome P450 6a14 n=1 Tax=Adelges cooleyi TaxID=133065 RepID=UPI00217F819D|nr:probable cytochrome P450 6a14 [Adelges cooleyi]XP_050427222.1 probable cytochrome P450 6a14 [Adelges cooleyi]
MSGSANRWTTAVEVWTVLLAALAFAVYKYCTYRYDYWKKRGVPHTRPTPLLGHFSGPVLRRAPLAYVVDDLYRKFAGHPCFGIYQARCPMLVVADTRLINAVMCKDFGSFHDRLPSDVSFKTDPLFKNLLNLRGAQWKAVRSKLTAIFSTAKLKNMYADMGVCIDGLVDKLQRLTPDGQAVINVNEVAANFTVDTIGRCAFGLDFGALSNPDSEFRRIGRISLENSSRKTILELIRLADLGWLIDLFRLRALPPEVFDFFINRFRELMEFRESDKDERNDFISLLIKLRNEERASTSGEDVVFTDEVLASNAFVFFLAGFETTSTTIGYCLYELALNPDVQTRLREELQRTAEANDGKFPYDSLKAMTYLDQVLNESLRVHPTVPAVARTCNKTYTVPGTDITIDPGVKVLIPIYSLHHDSKYYENPDQFDPERFAEDKRASRPPGCFLPFGDGPRICIGMRFGLMEAKAGLAEILSKFEVHPCERTPKTVELLPGSILLTPKNPIFLSFKRVQTK